MPGRAADARSLFPKEHGAYGQLALPLVAALAMGSPSLASLLLAVGAALAFVAHEPLLVVLGARGSRARAEDGPRAARVGVVCGAAALAAGAAGMWLGGRPVAIAALAPLALTLALVPFIFLGREKTAPGELAAAAALSGAALPVAIAGGVPQPAALVAWSAWVVGFTAGTSAVRGVIKRHKRGARGATDVWLLALSSAGAAALVALDRVGAGALPMVVASIVILALAPHPRNLKKLGWTLVASSAATVALLVALG